MSTPNKYGNKFRMALPKVSADDPNTRQRRRAECRKVSWRDWSVLRDQFFRIVSAPQDDQGIIPRWIRRDIAKKNARKAAKLMGRPGTVTNVGQRTA